MRARREPRGGGSRGSLRRRGPQHGGQNTTPTTHGRRRLLPYRASRRPPRREVSSARAPARGGADHEAARRLVCSARRHCSTPATPRDTHIFYRAVKHHRLPHSSARTLTPPNARAPSGAYREGSHPPPCAFARLALAELCRRCRGSQGVYIINIASLIVTTPSRSLTQPQHN